MAVARLRVRCDFRGSQKPRSRNARAMAVVARATTRIGLDRQKKCVIRLWSSACTARVRGGVSLGLPILAAWQRGHELLLLSEELLKRKPRLRFQKRFREQLTDAASSIPRNVAEGFGRYRPRENAQYVRIAKGSANEVLSLFFEARARRVSNGGGVSAFQNSRRPTIGTLIGYLRYLESCQPPVEGADRELPKPLATKNTHSRTLGTRNLATLQPPQPRNRATA